MGIPSQMSLRRIPDALHLKVRIAYAAAWESLIDTYARQMLEFVCEFASRVPALDGMDLFLRVIPIPDTMQEVVRCRTLTSLDTESLQPLTRRPRLTGWRRLRLDLVLEHQRAQRRYQERTLELARMVGARAAEQVIATHVENAVDFTRLVKGVLSTSDATEHYIVEFSIPDTIAQMVNQRVRARIAGDELTAQTDELPPHLFEAETPSPMQTPHAIYPSTEPVRQFRIP